MKTHTFSHILVFLLFSTTLQAQEKTVLTIDRAIDIALHGSYTVRSNDESRRAIQHNGKYSIFLDYNGKYSYFCF